jgi:hypothetical protein
MRIIHQVLQINVIDKYRCSFKYNFQSAATFHTYTTAIYTVIAH